MSVKVVETTVNPVVVQSATAFNAAHAQIWAEGTDPQVEKLGGVHSAKGWAEVASHLSSPEWGDIEGDIENQTDLQNALNAKQATISDLETIRSGAALGATAVQPGDLATVATTGAYNDLTGKPGVMAGADGTNPGTSGFVPAPAATDNEKFLRGDGTWAEAGSQGGGTWGTITGTLSDQTDLQTALNAKADNFTIGEGLEWQAGRVLTAPDHLPPNVFTKDNVTAGADIEINQIIDPYVLNEDTLACFHFDGDTTNAVSTGVTLSNDFKAAISGYTDPLVNPWYPGRSAAIWAPANNVRNVPLFAEDFTTFGTLEDYTLEFFVTGNNNIEIAITATNPAHDTTNMYPRVETKYDGYSPTYYVRCTAGSGAQTDTGRFSYGTFSHVAIVRKNQVVSVYVNGTLMSQAANSLNFANFLVQPQYDGQAFSIAEMVFSKIAKWDGDFTPPTAPYHQQEGGNQYEIKSTVIEKHATNCLLEVPQRINLELSSGTLTLKAGSKVYVPNGVNSFSDVTIANDLAATPTATGKNLLFTNADGSVLMWRAVASTSSGTSDPGSTGTTYYNTSTNIITAHNSGGDVQASFPIAQFTGNSSNVVSSVDQIFNGFGYVGSTIFAFPGVKGLIPDGRNEDGSLKNVEYVQPSIYTNTLSGTKSYVFHLGEGGAHESTNFVSQETEPTENYTLWYRPSENRMYRKSSAGVVVANNDFVCATGTTDNGAITLYVPRTVIRALDYNDKQIITGWGAPSNKYVTLTPTNGATYTPPADGWFVLYGVSNNTADAYLYVANNGETRQTSPRVTAFSVPQSNMIVPLQFPCKAGDIVKLEYSFVVFSYSGYYNLGLKFFYLEGNKPEGN